METTWNKLIFRNACKLYKLYYNTAIKYFILHYFNEILLMFDFLWKRRKKNLSLLPPYANKICLANYRGIHFLECVNFFPTYCTMSLNFFPISSSHFYCFLLNFFPNLNFGWTVSLPRKQVICKNIYPGWFAYLWFLNCFLILNKLHMQNVTLVWDETKKSKINK